MNTLSEQDLRRALAPVRPDPEEFKRAVERKLAEREGERGESAPVPASAWRQAAAVLPLDLLAPAGVPVAALGKKLGLGGAAGVLALPVVSLAMLALAFVTALRVVLRSGAAGAAERRAATPSAGEVLRSWWRAHALPAAVAIALLVVLAWTQPAETVLLVLLLSMGVVTVLVARLARAGAATRASVGEFTAEFLGALLGLSLIFNGLGEGLSSAHVAAHWAPTALFFGCLMCDVIGRWRRGWSPLAKLAGALLPAALCGVWLAALAGRVQPVGPEQMVGFVESQPPAREDVVEWQRRGRVGEWLLENELPFERSAARRSIEEAWEQDEEAAFDGRLGLHTLTAAARAELLSEDVWEALAADEETAELLRFDGSLFAPSHVELRIRALARAGLTEEQRDHLAQRLADTWPEPDAVRALEDMAGIEELAERIGRPIGAERRAEVDQALWLHWRGADPDEAFAAPFASERWRAGSRRLGDLLYLNATHAAVRLMARFGAGERIDPARVRAFLEGAATPSIIEVLSPAAWSGVTTQGYRYDAAVALRRFEALPEVRALSRAQESWQAERVLTATLLLVALCLFATLRAGARAPATQRPVA